MKDEKAHLRTLKKRQEVKPKIVIEQHADEAAEDDDDGDEMRHPLDNRWKRWCRLCAKEDNAGNVNIFIKNEHNLPDTALVTAIGKYFWLNIKINDDASTYLCCECHTLIDELVIFTERVNKVQTLFSTLIASNGEPIDPHELRLQYGLLDDERQHIIRSPNTVDYAIEEVQEFHDETTTVMRRKSVGKLQPAEYVSVGQAEDEIASHVEEEEDQLVEETYNGGSSYGEDEEFFFVDDDETVLSRVKKEQKTPTSFADDADETGDDTEVNEEVADGEDDGDDEGEDTEINEDAVEDSEEHLYEDAVDDDAGDDEDIDETALTTEEENNDDDGDETELNEDAVSTSDNNADKVNKHRDSNEKVSATSSRQSQSVKRKRGRPSKASSNFTTDSEQTQTPPRPSKRLKVEHNEGDENAPSFRFECTHCPKKYKGLLLYRKHMKDVHNITDDTVVEYSCEDCGKVFPTERQVLSHSRVHLPIEMKQVFACEYCPKKFTKDSILQQHISGVHLNEKPFVCEECGRSLKTNAALREHQLTHTNDCPFECEVCHKSFKNKARLKIHADIHNGTVYTCVECGLQLNTRRTLNMHMLVHSEVKRFKCDYCGNEFKRAKALKNHLIIHTGLRPYTCNFCSKSFSNGSNCRSHKKKAHPEELAEMEAAGTVVMSTGVPKLDMLRAVTKAADNLKPVTKQSTLPPNWRDILLKAEARANRLAERKPADSATEATETVADEEQMIEIVMQDEMGGEIESQIEAMDS